MIADDSGNTESYAGAGNGLTCIERNGLVVRVYKATFRVESGHPRGSAGMMVGACLDVLRMCPMSVASDTDDSEDAW